MNVDLRPYGIGDAVNAAFLQSDLASGIVVRGSHSTTALGAIDRITMDGVRYRVLKQLGAGTYGTTFRVEHPGTGTRYAIKVVNELDTEASRNYFFSECVIQILLAEASRGQPNGPFVPDVYGVACDPVTYHGYLRSELMENTLLNLTDALTPAENDTVVPDALTQIAQCLKYFGTALEFNHRDLHCGNVMFVTRGDGTRRFKLIDFGFSCLKLPNGGRLLGGNYFETSPTCFKKDRDLSQLMYYCFISKNMSPELQARLAHILQATVKNPKRHICQMAKKCPVDGLIEWRHTYRFLDRANVSVPLGDPDSVMNQMRRHVAKEPLKTRKATKPRTPKAVKAPTLIPPVRVPAPKICPPGTVLNPASGRCVKADGAVGKKLLGVVAPPALPAAPAPAPAMPAPCPPGTERSAVSGRCIKVCPPGQERVPGTRKCRKVPVA